MSEARPALPERLPIFPLPGVVLLPGGRLPLNIFEPRYLDMARDAMGEHRMIGMIQPTDPAHGLHAPEVYKTGGAGRITAFQETPDGRFLITLTGVSRFNIIQELDAGTRYRQVIPDWDSFAEDLAGHADGESIGRERLLGVLQTYFASHRIAADLGASANAPPGVLVNAMAMLCPFTPSEKQALLEAATVGERSRVMITLMEMAIAQRAGGLDDDVSRH